MGDAREAGPASLEPLAPGEHFQEKATRKLFGQKRNLRSLHWQFDKDAKTPGMIEVPENIIKEILDVVIGLGHHNYCTAPSKQKCICGLAKVKSLRQRQQAASNGGAARALALRKAGRLERYVKRISKARWGK